MEKYKLSFGSNENLSVNTIAAYIDASVKYSAEFIYDRYGEAAGRHADLEVRLVETEELLWVAEIKIDADALKSRNDRHYWNNLAQLRDDYDCARYVLLVDTGKMNSYFDNNSRKCYKQAVFTKPLIGDMMYAAITIGKCIPRYMDMKHFAEKVIEITKNPILNIDCGIRYWERKPGSKFEVSRQVYNGVTAASAAIIAQKWQNEREMIWDATGWDPEKKVFTWHPEYWDLDAIWPPNKDGSEHADRIKYEEVIGG